jgi:hypothetical protein
VPLDAPEPPEPIVSAPPDPSVEECPLLHEAKPGDSAAVQMATER